LSVTYNILQKINKNYYTERVDEEERDKKYLQRRNHRSTQGRIPINLIYIKNVTVKETIR
jgi:hypothetical protein